MVIEMEKSDTYWVLLAITGIVLVFLAGFNTTPPTLLNYLSLGFLAGGVVALILAALEYGRRNRV